MLRFKSDVYPVIRLSQDRLSETSSLVMLWADGAIHTSDNARAYLKLLDLSPGMNLFSRCNRIWSHYGEVIKNRKWCMREILLRDLAAGESKQVVILGSGMDALSLEIASRGGGIKIYEVDAAAMEQKKKLIERANADPDNSIRCITADLRDGESVLNCMKAMGWNERESSILVLEGISYFLPEKSLWDLVSLFGGCQKNRLLLEYLLVEDMISGDRSCIPRLVFGAIQDSLAAGERLQISRYDECKIRDSLSRIGGGVIRRYEMREMEVGRTGGSMHFGLDKSWWIEICHAVL